MAVFASIIEALNTWHIGGVSFASTAESKDYREFAYLFVSLDPENMPSPTDLQEALQNAGVKGIELEEPKTLQLQHLAEGEGTAGGIGTRPGGSTSSPEDSKEKRRALAKGRYAKAASALGDLTKTRVPAAPSVSNRPNGRFKTSSNC